MTNVLRELIKEVEAGRLPQAELAAERIKVCEACPSFRTMLRQCSECHCFMDLKTKFLRTGCPLDKW